MLQIVKTTPSSIHVRDGDKLIKVEGESFARGFGSPDFIIHIDSIRQWASPGGPIDISPAERQQIVKFLLDELSKRNWIITAE
jgi:hypothetical protein